MAVTHPKSSCTVTGRSLARQDAANARQAIQRVLFVIGITNCVALIARRRADPAEARVVTKKLDTLEERRSIWTRLYAAVRCGRRVVVQVRGDLRRTSDTDAYDENGKKSRECAHCEFPKAPNLGSNLNALLTIVNRKFYPR